MKKIKSYFVLIAIMLFGFFVCSNDMVSAETSVSNFSNDKVTVSNSDGEYPFDNAVKDGLDVIKSTNAGVNNSESSLTLTFTGIGEIGFKYLVSSEKGWDSIVVSANGKDVLIDSGDQEGWKSFSWYSEENTTNNIVVKYVKDIGGFSGEDCCYLTELTFDSTLYSPLLNFNIDGELYNSSATVYYDYNENDGVLSFEDATDYVIEVKLNGTFLGNEISYELKKAPSYKINNVIEISYKTSTFKTRNITVFYNASLDYVGTGVSFVNDEGNSFILDQYRDSGVLAVKSTITEDGTESILAIDFSGSGVLTFSYLVSGRDNYDYFRVYVSGILMIEETGNFENFETVSLRFYENKENRVVFSYSSNTGEYLIGDDCFYLKDVSFEAVDYSGTGTVKLNGSEVNDGSKVVMGSEEVYKLTVEDLENDVSAEVYLNGEPVEFNNEENAYILNDLEDSNVIAVIFSEGETSTRAIGVYLYKETLNESENVQNDANYPFVRDFYEGEEVIKSSNTDANTSSTLSFTANSRGNLTFSYLAATEKGDLLIVKVNERIVLKVSDSKAWKSASLNLLAGDVVSFTYKKDASTGDLAGNVYLTSLFFREKNYADISGATIGGVDFINGVNTLYFDWENKDNSVIVFENLLETQSVVVKVNGQNVVADANGHYNLGEVLQYTNNIVVICSETGFDDLTIEFKYNANLISNSNIGYTSSDAYILREIENEKVISIDPNYTSLDLETLRLTLSGTGHFKMSFNYFTYSNLNVEICIDSVECINVTADEYEMKKWHNVSNRFLGSGDHYVTIRVSGEEFYGNIDYIYFKDFDFVNDSVIDDLLKGDGTSDSPYDIGKVLETLSDFGIKTYNKNIYNYDNANTVFVVGVEGYDYYLNGELVEYESIMTLIINAKGKSTLVISNGIETVTLNFYNEGVNGTNITNGYGTSENPYEIYTVQQFADLSKINEYYYYILKDNLSLSGFWTGIGTYDVPFTGYFDGNNKTITGLVIESGIYSGLFAVVNDATIKNLIIENAVISGSQNAGTLIGYSNNVEVSNVKIINTEVYLCDIEQESELVAGGVVGVAENSSFYEIIISGSVKINSMFENAAGGLSGIGGNFYNSSTTVNVEGTGFVGGAIGYSNYAILDNVEVLGDVKLSTNYIESSSLGILASDENLYTVLSSHKITGTYSSDVTITSAKVYGIGLRKEGFNVTFTGNRFSVDVVFEADEDNGICGNYASVSGYVIAFKMADGSFRYYELFDFANNEIKSNNIDINLDDLTEYSNNMSTLTVNTDSPLYEVVELYGENVSSYLTVEVSDALTFEHLSIMINYGLPVNLGSYYTYGTNNLTINFVITGSMDFSESNFRGIANSKAFPYMGSIDGRYNTIKLGINNPNARLGSFINYASSTEKTVVKNLRLEGTVIAKFYASFVGDFSAENGEIIFENITNYMVVNSMKGASLLSNLSRNKVTFINCVNYADFKEYVFFNGRGNNINYSGINANYGSASSIVNKDNVNRVFFGTINANSIGENAKLENYYTLKGLQKDDEIIIDGIKYFADDNGEVKFIMNNDNLYVAVISADLLVEKEYSLSTTFVGEIKLPKNVKFDSSSKVEKASDEDWNLVGVVTFYDNSTETISFSTSLSEDDLLGNELVFADIDLVHETYKITEKVTLKRTTALLEEYKTDFENFVNAEEGFVEKAVSLKNKYDYISSIYTTGNVSENTLEYYTNYLEVNGIRNEDLDTWFSLIVSNISLKDGSDTVIYGDEATFVVVVTYLNGQTTEKEVEFDYAIEDIEDDYVTIHSKEPFVVVKDDKELYNKTISYVLPVSKKTLTATVEQYQFEYDGEAKSLDIKINFNNKFNDIISNFVVVYLNSDDVVVLNPVNAGEYKVAVNLNITNSEYYVLDELNVGNLVITHKEVEIVWNGTIEGTYTGEERINEISAYYVEDFEEVPVGFNVDSIKNAGDYVVSVVFENENYKAKGETGSRTFTISKANLVITIADYEVSYKESIPNIVISSKGVLGSDLVDVFYNIVKDDVYYELSLNLECGIYDLLVVINNDRELKVNYNITVNNGTLKIIGINTEILVDDTVSYAYKGTEFSATYANIVLKDATGAVLEGREFKYTYVKNGETVANAIGVGTYSVTVKFESTKEYNGCEKTFTLIIEQLVVTIAIDNKESVYGDEIVPLTYTITSGKVHSIESLALQLTKEDGLSVGKYAITATYNNANYDITFIDGEYEIKQRAIQVVIDSKESNYLEELKELTYTINGYVAEGDDLNIVITKDEGLTAGSYFITGTYNNDQYDVSFVRGVYTIKKIDIVGVTFEDVSVTYNGKKVEFGVSNKELSDGSKADVVYYSDEIVIEEIVNAGLYEINAVMKNPNYNDLVLSAVVEVKKAENTIEYENESEEYQYSSEGYDYRLTNTTFEDGRNANVTYRILKGDDMVEEIVELGEYVIIAEINDDLENYKRRFVSKTITIVQKRLIVEYGSTELVYNANKQHPSVRSEEPYEMLFNTEDGLAPKNVGRYTMTIKPINDNYRIINSVTEFNIIELEVAFENFENREQTYCGCSFVNDIKTSNVDVFDDVTITYAYYFDNELVDDMVNVGVYTIEVVSITGSDAANYKLGTNNTMTLTIVPKELVVKPLMSSKTFGDEDPTIEYELSEELFDGDSMSGSLARESGEDVGNYIINLGTLTAGSNYVLSIDSEEVAFAIVPRPVEIEYDVNQEFYYDGTEQILDVTVVGGAHIEYEGDRINVGSYTIKVVIDDENYCLPKDYEDITVVINKRDVKNNISIEQTEYDYTGANIVPVVDCGGYECTIKYLSDNEVVTSIINPGTYVINVVVDTKTDSANVDIEIVVKKAKGVSRDVTLDIYHNKIIVENHMELEYRIDNGEYTSINIFTGLRENTSYRISVRVKESALTYASDPVIYEIKTTKNPSIIHDIINKLTDEVNEKNLTLIKEIENNLKAVNEKEIDAEKLEFYKNVKEKFENAMSSYEENLTVSNKVADFVEFGVIMAMVVIPILAVLFVVKRRIESL